MFNYNHPMPGGVFPPDRPLTAMEENEHTKAEMRKTIDRLLAFEQRMKDDFDRMLRHITQDNTIFKDTYNTSYQTFIKAVENEINEFEANVSNSITLFTENLEKNYAGLDEKVTSDLAAFEKKYAEDFATLQKSLEDEYASFVQSVNVTITEYKEEANEQYESLLQNVNTRINANNTEHAQAFADYQRKLTTDVNMFEASVNAQIQTFIESVNNTLLSFRETWETIIATRLATQDARISDAELYMKTNLEANVQTQLGDMADSGRLQEMAFSTIGGDIYAQVQRTIDTMAENGELGLAVADVLQDTIENEAAKAVAGKTNLLPKFADTIAECTDKESLYVLPDGMIYAHMAVPVPVEPKNQITFSQNADGSAYVGENGENGYKVNYKVSGSEGVEKAQNNYCCTGYIPFKASDFIRTRNIIFTEVSNCNLSFYDENHAHLGFLNMASYTEQLKGMVNDEGNLEGVISDCYSATLTDEVLAKICYLRLSATTFAISNDGNPDNDGILTLNEPATTYYGTEDRWESTGRAFIPADYEPRILELEENAAELAEGVEKNKEAIKALSANGDTPSYVVKEADRVAKAVNAVQNENTISFLAISDAHYLEGNTNIENGILHAGQGMEQIRKSVNIDFGAVLGDNGCGSSVVGSPYRATIEKGISEIMATNKCVAESLRDIPNFRVPGNHDTLIFNYSFNGNKHLTASDLFPLYGGYNRGAVYDTGERARGYCFRDFEEMKLRVIALNTADISDLTPSDTTKQNYLSGTQGKWFADSIDLSDKEDAASWQILILSHAPLDWGSGCIYLCDILKAYTEGKSVTIERDGVNIYYDYAGKNTAQIIGNCHGHNHNFQYGFLHRYVEGNTTEEISIKRFCIPNACFERTNEKGENSEPEVWDIEFGETVSYEKIAGTAKDTAFCVVTIDTAKRKIYAHTYGAGYDREIDY